MNMNEWIQSLGMPENKQTLASLKVGGEKVGVCTCKAQKTVAPRQRTRKPIPKHCADS